jgi:hypothetical protein
MARDGCTFSGITLLSPLGPLRELGGKRWVHEWQGMIEIIEPGVRDAWQNFGGDWKGSAATTKAVEMADSHVVRLLTAILATAILFEEYGSLPASEPASESADGEEHRRGNTRRRVAKHRRAKRPGSIKRLAERREDFVRAAALEAHRSTFYFERPAAPKGRPSSPGLDYLARRARGLFSSLRDGDLVGLRIRSGFPWCKALSVILGNVPEAKLLLDRLPRNREAQALSQLAARL